MSNGVAGHEFNVNESIMYILNAMSLRPDYVFYHCKKLMAETPRNPTPPLIEQWFSIAVLVSMES